MMAIPIDTKDATTLSEFFGRVPYFALLEMFLLLEQILFRVGLFFHRIWLKIFTQTNSFKVGFRWLFHTLISWE